jgi:lipoprotein-anchoring transpeptidase ErfK/SrfK
VPEHSKTDIRTRWARRGNALTSTALALYLGLSATPANAAPTLTVFPRTYPAGAVVIANHERRLYYVLGNGRALAYTISVGVSDSQWTGQSFVQSKAKNPSWTPPWDPSKTIPPGPGNPMGTHALYLGWSLYRIHGTNTPGSVGFAASHGCFRMYNQDVADLYERVHLGAPVYVVDRL